MKTVLFLAACVASACGSSRSCDFGVYPPPGATSVPLDAALLLTFGGEWLPSYGALDGSAELVDLETGKSVALKYAFVQEPPSVRLVPVGGLRADHRYRLTGLDMDKLAHWHHSTGAQYAAYSNTVVSSEFTTGHTPVLLAASAGVEFFWGPTEIEGIEEPMTILNLLFSEPMDVASLSGAVRVANPAGEWISVTGALEVDDRDTRIVTVSIPSPYQSAVEVAATARSARGMPLAQTATQTSGPLVEDYEQDDVRFGSLEGRPLCQSRGIH